MGGYCGNLYQNQDGDTDNIRPDQRCDYKREHPPLRSDVEWSLGNIGNGKASGMDGSVLMLRKSMAERKMRFFGHIVRKNGMEKSVMQGKTEGKRRRGRPATTWFQDLKEWTKLDIAAASQLATDRERWRKIIKFTAAQIAPPDERE